MKRSQVFSIGSADTIPIGLSMFLRAQLAIILHCAAHPGIRDLKKISMPADIEIGFALIYILLDTGRVDYSRDVNESVRHWHQIAHHHVRKSVSGSLTTRKS